MMECEKWEHLWRERKLLRWRQTMIVKFNTFTLSAATWALCNCWTYPFDISWILIHRLFVVLDEMQLGFFGILRHLQFFETVSSFSEIPRKINQNVSNSCTTSCKVSQITSPFHLKQQDRIIRRDRDQFDRIKLNFNLNCRSHFLFHTQTGNSAELNNIWATYPTFADRLRIVHCWQLTSLGSGQELVKIWFY